MAATQIMVSVVMPVHNGLPYVREALESLLAQTLTEIEILVLNDGSTDGTAEYLNGVDDPRVRVTHFEKQGYVPLLNHGLRQAQGRFVARMDADDVALPQRLELQMRFMEQNPDVSVVGCQALKIDSTGTVLGLWSFPTSATQIFYRLSVYPPLLHPGVLMRREAIDAAGEYQTCYTTAEDYDFWWRLSSQGRIANLDSVLVRYRIHPSSVSQSQSERQLQVVLKICGFHLMQRGFAQTSEQAADYWLCHRNLFATNRAITIAQWQNYLKVFERVAAHALVTFADAQDEIAEQRKQIRWALLERSKHLGGNLVERWRLINLARQADPDGMKPARLFQHALDKARHLFRSPGAAAGCVFCTVCVLAV